MNATDAMGEGDRKEGNPSPEDGAVAVAAAVFVPRLAALFV